MENAKKEIATYLLYNPLSMGASYIAIDTGTFPHEVFAVFHGAVPLKTNRQGNIIILSASEAVQKYEFRQASECPSIIQ